MLTKELMNDKKYENYNAKIDLHGKKYDDIEKEYISKLFLICYKEHQKNPSGMTFDEFQNNFYPEYSTRPVDSILKKAKEYISEYYKLKIYSTNSKFGKDYHHINIKEVINSIEDIKNDINFFKCKIISPSSKNPIMSINDVILSEDETMSLRKAFNREKNIYKSFIFDYLKKHNKNKHGLCLNIAPTGSGKSYYTNNFISTDLLEDLIFNPTSLNKKVFYITDLKTNLLDSYNTAYDIIINFCYSYSLNDNIKEYLLSKICCVLSKADIIKSIKDSREYSVYYSLIESMAEKYNNQDILPQLKNQLDAIKSFDDNAKFQIEDVYKNIKLFFLKNLPNCNKKELKIINMFFIGEEIYNDNKNGPCIFFLTTAKAVFGIDTLYYKTYIFEEKNNIFFIDEADKQYGVLLSQSIKNTNEFDLYDMIRSISSLRYRKFKIDLSHQNETIENLRKKFVNEILQPFLTKYIYENSLELKNHNGTFSIFYDNISPFIVNKKQFAKLTIDAEKNVNIIEVRPSEYIQYDKNGKEFTNLILDSQRVLRSFIYFMRKIAETYSSEHKYNREMSHSDKIKLLLEEVNLLDLLVYVTDYKKKKNSYKIIDKDLDIIRLKPTYENASLIQRKYSNNPNTTILKCAKNNFVNFISATANHDSVITNFHLDYLREGLGKYFIEYSNEDKINLNIELKQKHKNITDNININIMTPPEHIDRITYDSLTHDCFLKLDDYKKIRVYEYFNAIFDFLSKKSSKIILMAASAFPEFYTIDKIDSVLKNNFNFTNFRIYPNKECDKFNAEFLRDLEKVNEMYKYLDSDQNNKVIIITTYNTVGAGVNIQPTNTSGINLSEYIAVDEARKDDYDIDSLYLAKPTHLLTSTDNTELNMEEILTISTHLRTLLDKNIISFDVYNGFLRQIADNIKVKSTIDKFHKNTEDYIPAVFAKVKQMIGRISRTNLRNKNINIYVSNELADILYGESCPVELFDTPEYIKFTNFIKLYETDQVKKTKITLDLYHNKNINTTMFFNSIKEHILHNAYYDKNEFYIEQWHQLRMLCLKNGVFLNEQAVEDFSDIGFKECLLSFKEASSSYFYSKKDEFIYEYNNDSIFPSKKSYRLIDDKSLNLHIISLNKELSNHFKEEGYVLNFTESKSALPYPMINDIYKGAIGEVIGKYVCEERFGIKINNDRSFNNDLFEVCDFFCLHPSLIIGVDMKNYNLSLNNEEYNKRILFRIETKIENKMLDKIILINTFLDDRKEVIKYGNIVDGQFFNNDISNSKVCIINGLLRSDGYFCDYSEYLKKLKEWINE